MRPLLYSHRRRKDLNTRRRWFSLVDLRTSLRKNSFEVQVTLCKRLAVQL
jgi:hypothetical protein